MKPKANETFLLGCRGLNSPQSFPPAYLAIAKADNKRQMKPRATKKKRGK